MNPFIQVYLTIDFVFHKKGMLRIYDQTSTTLLNILRSQTRDSDLYIDLRVKFIPLTNTWKCTGGIDNWRQRQRRGRASGNTIKNGVNSVPAKVMNEELDMVGVVGKQRTNARDGGKGSSEDEEQGQQYLDYPKRNVK